MGACVKCNRNVNGARCMYCGATQAPMKACPKCQRKFEQSVPRCTYCAIDLAVPAGAAAAPAAVTVARGEAFQRAEQLRKAGQLAAAVDLLDQVLLVDPRFIPAWIARGKCFAASNEFGGAFDSARAALAIDPTHAEAKSLSETWKQKAPTKAAEEAQARALEAHHEAHRLLQAGQNAEALVLFDRLAAAIRPERRDDASNAALYDARALTLQRLGRFADALVCLDEALRVNPQHAGAWQKRASVLDDLGKDDEALAAAERAVAVDPQRADAWCDLGHYRQKRGLLKEARAAYQKALAVNPQHPVALRNLGSLVLNN